MRQDRETSERRITFALVERLFLLMKNRIYPSGISDEDFKKYLFAVAHVLRYAAKDVPAGRKSKFSRETLLSQAAILREVLDEETSGWLKLPFFITNCVPVLWYPSDVRRALDACRINLEEARILSLVTGKNLGSKTKTDPQHIRRELLESHLLRSGTQKELRRRVNARLGRTSKVEAESVTRVITALHHEIDDLLKIDESDTDHLLWEDIKNLVFLARDVDVSQIDEPAFAELLDDLDKIQYKLAKYKPHPGKLSEETRVHKKLCKRI